MTIPRLTALSKYWQQHPPVHLIVAGLAGYKPPPEKKIQTDEQQSTENNLDELMGLFQSMGGEVIRGNS